MDCLPTVDKCCFCVDLKWGSLIIAILSLASLSVSGFTIFSYDSVVIVTPDPHPSLLCDESSLFSKISRYTGYVVLAVQIAVLITSILLIVGIVLSKPELATAFIYAVLASIAVNVFFLIISLLSGIIDSGCDFPIPNIVLSVILILIWVYFMIVVNSYQQGM